MDLKSRSAWSGFFLLVIPAHPEKGGEGRRRFSTAEWLVIQSLGV